MGTGSDDAAVKVALTHGTVMRPVVGVRRARARPGRWPRRGWSRCGAGAERRL